MQPQLECRVHTLRKDLADAESRLTNARARAEVVAARLAALDGATQAIDSRVRPDALGVIHAWAGRYGERGALQRFLRVQLQAAGTQGVSASELVLAAAVAFDLDFATPKEAQDFWQNSARTRLREWRDQGPVGMEYRKQGAKRVAYWSWKRGPTLADLADFASQGLPRPSGT
jgi:hypothetical protein